jgi:hypothetical protein
MGPHVQAVGDQRHGVEGQAADQLGRQGQHADGRDDPGAALIMRMIGAQIDAVGPEAVHLSLSFGRGGGHKVSFIWRRSPWRSVIR